MKKSHYFKVWAHCLRQLSQKLFALFQGSTIRGSTNQGITVLGFSPWAWAFEWEVFTWLKIMAIELWFKELFWIQGYWQKNWYVAFWLNILSSTILDQPLASILSLESIDGLQGVLGGQTPLRLKIWVAPPPWQIVELVTP